MNLGLCVKRSHAIIPLAFSHFLSGAHEALLFGLLVTGHIQSKPLINSLYTNL